MKNFRGCDVDKNFAFTFDSKNCKTGIQFFLLEQIFYFADIQDLILADEILASQSENKEFDLFRAKKALIDDDINKLKSILSRIDSNPNVSIILRETDIGKGHMVSYTERLKLLKCELAVRENEFDKAEKMIGDLSENAQVLSMKESYRKLSTYRKRRFIENSGNSFKGSNIWIQKWQKICFEKLFKKCETESQLVAYFLSFGENVFIN